MAARRMFLVDLVEVRPDILFLVSQAERVAAEKLLRDLPSEERAWLDEQLATYRELLVYLHDH